MKEVIVPADDLVCLGKDKLQELVRCKDCTRWRQSKTNTAAKVCDWDRYEKTENDYCSWAVKKMDEVE